MMSKPKAFRTLRGLFEGSEPDEPTYFAYSASLRVSGNDLNFGELEARIGVSPTHSHRKGERRGPRSPPAGYRSDLWSYSPPIHEAEPLHRHIDALWGTIGHAEEYLRNLKRSATIDVFLGYRTNIDHAGFEVPNSSLEMFVRLEIPFGVSIIVTPMEEA
jgi:hypothetical protein